MAESLELVAGADHVREALLELEEVKDADAAALVKLLSADGSVVSGVMVVWITSQTSPSGEPGERLRLRSPSPSIEKLPCKPSRISPATGLIVHPPRGLGRRKLDDWL